MCLGSSRWSSSSFSHKPMIRHRIKKSKVTVRLCARRSWREESESVRRGMEMAVQNLKLYLENRCMMEENEILRKRALLLDQENRALLAQIKEKEKFSHLNDNI